MMRRLAYFLFIAALIIGACGSDTGEDPTTTSAIEPGGDIASTTTTTSTTEVDQEFPDIVDAEAELEDGGTYNFAVTVSSPYDSPERYADAWRVVTEDGTVLGVRELTHDHANEQPFTRSLGGVEVPEGVSSVVVEGRDLVNGWGGETFEVELPDR